MGDCNAAPEGAAEEEREEMQMLLAQPRAQAFNVYWCQKWCEDEEQEPCVAVAYDHAAGWCTRYRAMKSGRPYIGDGAPKTSTCYVQMAVPQAMAPAQTNQTWSLFGVDTGLTPGEWSVSRGSDSVEQCFKSLRT